MAEAANSTVLKLKDVLILRLDSEQLRSTYNLIVSKPLIKSLVETKMPSVEEAACPMSCSARCATLASM
jgi:hypothetical protein